MNPAWRIHVTDKENLREILNLLLLNRETEIAVRRNGGISIFVRKEQREMEVIQYIRNELGNKIEDLHIMPARKENVFLSNPPKFYLNSSFPFFVETALFPVNGDTIYVKEEVYRTFNVFRRKSLGGKNARITHRLRINSPFLYRHYSDFEGYQSLTGRRGYPIILTSREVNSLINGGGKNGLLAV